MIDKWQLVSETIPSHTSNNEVLVKFENGSVRRLSEELPELKITHWFLTSKDVKEILNLTIWKK